MQATCVGSVAAVGLEAHYCSRKRRLLRNGVGFLTVGVGPQANFSGRTPNYILKFYVVHSDMFVIFICFMQM
jgi:hypothetical protein